MIPPQPLSLLKGPGKKKTSLQSQRRTGRRIQGATGCSASPQDLEGEIVSNPGTHFQTYEGHKGHQD